MEQIIQTIRSRWQELLPQILQPAQRNVNGQTSYICPKCGHGSHGDGLTVNPKSHDGNAFKCFGCGFAGDIIDIYKEQTGNDTETAIKALASMLNINIEPDRTQSAATATNTDRTAYYRQCSERLADERAISYLSARGISYKVAAAHNVGFDPAADPAESGHAEPRLIFPTTRSHYVARAIRDTGDYKKINPKGATPSIYCMAALDAQEVQFVFVTEGVFDALSVYEIADIRQRKDIAAIALNSTSNAGKLIEQLERKQTDKTFIICLDNDPAGTAATETLTDGFKRLKTPFICADICNSHKDPNEALKADLERFAADITAAAMAADPDNNAYAVDLFLKKAKSTDYKPLPTGIKDIDNRIGGGLIKQWLVLLGAAAGTGKTALAAQIFENYAEQGQPCIYLNLEMSREQLLARSISRLAWKCNHDNKLDALTVLRGYEYTPENEKLIETTAQIYKQKIAPNMAYLADRNADLDSILSDLDARAERLIKKGRPAPLVCVDYLQLITGKKGEDNAAILKRAVVGLKQFAIKYNTIVLAIMAQSRQANESKEASISAGRDTSNLEYTADLQLQLIRNQENNANNEIDLFVTKSRFAAPSTTNAVRLNFNGAQSVFTMQADFYENYGKKENKNNIIYR